MLKVSPVSIHASIFLTPIISENILYMKRAEREEQDTSIRAVMKMAQLMPVSMISPWFII